MRLQGKVVIVTGGGHGIGLRYARGFAAEGASVVVAEVDADAAERAASEVRASGGRALEVATDVSDEASVKSMVARTISVFGKIDVLINNAALFAAAWDQRRPSEELTVEQWDRMFAVNVRGTWLCYAFDNLETFNIIDQVTAEGPNAKSQVVGTGPFMLKEWVQGDHITLVKNPNYWQAGRPHLDTIEYKILRDAQTMVAQFEAGTLHMVLNPPLRDIARLKTDPQYQAVTNPNTGRYYTAGWNVGSGPLSNKLVREALNFAMNRQRFADTILLGLSRPITLPWIPSSPAYQDDQANFFKFDLDNARSLLSQAGVGPFNLEYLISPNFPELAEFGQIYQADLAAIGVTATIKQADSAAFFDAINNRTYPGMYAITTARANLAPGITILSTQGFNPDQNNEGFSSDAYSQLANGIATETDTQKQKQLYSQMNDLLLDEAFAVAIASASPRMLLKSKVQGLDYTMHEGFVWTNIWLS